jgi:nitroimidazol reductase NimA-like FMN-containing flavoprotein (pyridoxamine 5'-phosphate oxidase superfamily)
MSAVFGDMSSRQCMDKLTEHRVGRVALSTPTGPEVYPVNYAVIDGNIVFRTSPYTRLGQSLRGAEVAFEIDEIDEPAETGWSVVAHGVATLVEEAEEIESLAQRLSRPWAPGQRNLFVRVRPQRVSGRYVGGRG